MFVGALSDRPDTPGEKVIKMLTWLKTTVMQLQTTHESAIELDKHEILQRIDMLAMTAQAVHVHGARPDLLLSARKDALVAMEAATDARSRAGWEQGRQAAAMLTMAASVMSSIPALLASAPSLSSPLSPDS